MSCTHTPCAQSARLLVCPATAALTRPANTLSLDQPSDGCVHKSPACCCLLPPQSAQEQQLSRLDEERTAMTHKWQQERSRLQRKLEHWNFEVLAQQREVNRLRQQLQQQGRLTAAGADPTSGGGR